MEQRKRIFGALDDLMRSPIGERLRERMFRELSTKEIHEMLQREQKPYKELMAYYQCALMEVETKFNVLDEELSLQYDRNPIETIKSRLKSPESILEKLNRRNLPITVESIEENITDVAGVRVICSHPADIYRLADSFLKQDDVTLIKKKDYIANPKPNGYRSLHLIIQVPIFLRNTKKYVYVEVQFRTIAMDFWASLEHKMRYKKNIPENQIKFLQDELYDCAQQSAALDKRMQKIRDIIVAEKEEE